MSPDQVSQLGEIIGADRISTLLPDRLANSRGTFPLEFKWIQSGPYPYIPDAVVWPRTAREVSAVLRWAQKAEMPVIPFGGGSGIVGGVVAERGGISLDLKKLTDLDIDERSLIANAGAGWIGQDLEDVLNARGYTLGHFPQSMHSSTVGGWIATRAIGTFSTQYGKIDDLVIGLQVVLPTGEVVTTNPAPQSSTGPAVKDIFIGCEGTFGVVTRAALRIRPKPEHRVLLGFTFRDVHSGLEAIRLTMRADVVPAVVRLYDEAEAESKLRVLGIGGRAVLLVLGFQGSRRQVEYKLSEFNQTAAECDGVNRGTEPGEMWYRSRLDTRGMLEVNRKLGGASDAVEVAASWSDLERLYLSVKQAAERHGALVHSHFSHFYPTGGSVYVIFFAQAANSPLAGAELYRRILGEMMDACIAAGGTISHHHGIGIAKAAWMRAEHNAGFDALLKIKKSLDPANILNPGKLGFPAAARYDERNGEPST